MSKEPVTLTLAMHLHGDVLSPATPGSDLHLDPDLAEHLVERVAVLPRSQAVRLRVQVTEPNAPRDQIPGAIRHHFTVLRERASYRLTRTTRAGRVSLVIGTVVLLLALVLAEALGRFATEGLSVVAREGLTIVGWVALWRPLDLLLFDRWALRREIALYRRLEEMEIDLAR